MTRENQDEQANPRPDDLAAELRSLPIDLKAPVDDGAARDLPGQKLPSLDLTSSDGGLVNLSAVRGYAVVYCYPKMAKDLAEMPEDWSAIPGARGCTYQSLKYSDGLAALTTLGAEVYGVSTESPTQQRATVERLGLKQPLLSDEERSFAQTLGLPAFEIGGDCYLRRLTMGVWDGVVARVWYPVFPPGDDLAKAREWLESRPNRSQT